VAHDPRPRRLEGRRALVTGAAAGIGAAIARRFASEGAAVALLDVDDERVAALAGETGGVAFVADVAVPAELRDAIAHGVEALGGLDVLVNNAGILRTAPVEELDLEEWDLVFATNVRSMVVATQAALGALRASPAPRIVNMASMGAKVGAPGQAAYAASKAAVVSLTQVCARELGPDGITVNCLCPGYVLTEMGAATRTPEQVAAWAAASPLGRLAEPEDVAAGALFLASDDGAYTTGQALNVNGGMTFH
jgi:3-oxoacyl-[acyl-carrier protein] reductase